MSKTGQTPGRPHPVVAAYIGTDESLLYILRKADDGNDPIVHAMRCLRECLSGQFPREEAMALAERAFPPPRGTDPDFYALFLGEWVFTALTYACFSAARAILNIANVVISKNRTPAEIRRRITWLGSLFPNADSIVISRDALALVSQDSPRYVTSLQGYLGALAGIGRLSEAEEECRRYGMLFHDRNTRRLQEAPYYFANAVETGRIEEALGWESTAVEANAGPETPLSGRRSIAERILALRLMRGERMHDKTILPCSLPAPEYSYWPAAVTGLLEHKPDEALRWAREQERHEPGAAIEVNPSFSVMTLLRAELAAGKASAARGILEKQLARRGHHYLDCLFWARIALLEDDRVVAARHFAAVRAECRRYGAEGRLDFELRMACELSPTDLLELGREPVPAKVPAGPPPAARPAAESRGAARLVGPSRALDAVREAILRAAPHDAPVLVTGETGTGKELVARAIHEESPRGNEPFVAVDCGTISENLLESELFGHERGAFTGADRALPGLFREAGRGTILLDEIGDIGPRLQGALLRVLESGEIRPVGAARSRRVHCRVIAATNAPLQASVEGGRFRKDLFYRLERLLIHVPPLRVRREDIAPLAIHFLSINRRGGERATLTAALEEELGERPWAGNVRELKNEMERLRLFNSDKLHYDLPDLPGAGAPPEAGQPAGKEAEVETQEPRQTSQSGGDENILSTGRSPMRMQQRLRELFARHNRLTTAEVRKLLTVSGSTATSYLKALSADGCIEKVRPTPSPRSHYFRVRSTGKPTGSVQSSDATGSLIGSQISLQRGSLNSSQKILALVAEHPEITINEMAVALQITTRAVKKQIRNLKSKHRLRRVGPDKGGHWETDN